MRNFLILGSDVLFLRIVEFGFSYIQAVSVWLEIKHVNLRAVKANMANIWWKGNNQRSREKKN